MSDPYIKVTRMKGGKFRYGVRCFSPAGKVFSQTKVRDRIEVGPAARSMLRMWDKCGGDSHYAHRARHRTGEKLMR